MGHASEACQEQRITVLDLDDFSVVNHRLDLLDRLKAMKPDLKITLFSVPAPVGRELEAGVEFLREVKAQRPWLEIALHGFRHTYLECRDWDYERALDVLLQAEATAVFVNGFKAPYWQTSDGLYRALEARGWWIADHERNNAKRPSTLPVYLLDRPGRVHGHIQNIGTNGLEELWDVYAGLEGPFAWASEVMAGKADA